MDEDCVNIEGIEQLWRIILNAPNDRLAADVTAYFVTLYLDVGPFLPPRKISTYPSLVSCGLPKTYESSRNYTF